MYQIKNQIIIFIFILATSVFGQEYQRVILSGNIADVENIEQFAGDLTDYLQGQAGKATLVLNGDLVNDGLSSKDSARVDFLLRSLGDLKQVKTVVIPGDRDWNDSGKNGLKKVKRLEKQIKALHQKNVIWAVKKGCPGPKVIELADDLWLVAVNTQWWNHPHNKPTPADADCKISTTDGFQEEIEDILDDNSGKNILIAGHFPLESGGNYGGTFPTADYLFPLTSLAEYLYLPLPFAGSIIPAFHKNIGGKKDIANSHFTPFRKLMKNVILHRDNIIYASAHEKNLQVLKEGNNYFINSGAPRKAKYSGRTDSTLWTDKIPGLIDLHYFDDGRVTAQIIQISKHDGFEFRKNIPLFRSLCAQEKTVIPVNTNINPCQKQIVSLSEKTENQQEKVNVSAGEEYAAGSIHRIFMGDHYRDSWTQKISVPILNLDSTFGGLAPYKRGGGRQTVSLKFHAANGMRYVFRSVNKNPVKALDYELRETIAADIVRDQTTTQHPYGAMAADILLNELDILHAHPKLFVMPDDPKLAAFREKYAGLLGMLEELPSNPDEGERTFAQADEILRSFKMFRQLYRKQSNRVDETAFARARVFDILVGDWGKHEDNWKWAGYKTDQGTLYKPIPRDRDHVFSRWDGLLPWLADREWAKESGENFDYEIVGLPSLVFQARHLDRFVATGLSHADWIAACEFVQSRLTDAVIDSAVRNMPVEIYEISGRIIAEKLKQRRNDLQKYVSDFYAMLADEVDVIGSNQNEYFKINRNNDGSVRVTVNDVKKNGKVGKQLLYERTFLPNETSEIRLYGLDGHDVFNLAGRSEKSILVRIIGGGDQDDVYDRSEVSGSGNYTLVYENNSQADIYAGTEAERVESAPDEAYEYQRTSFAYDTYFPLPFIGYNADDGFIFSFGIDYSNQVFGKKPYGLKHGFRLSGSTSNMLKFNYYLRFHQVIADWDVELNGTYAAPDQYTSFFGLGNDSQKEDDLYSANFYDTRFESKRVSAALINDFWKTSSLVIKAQYENNEAQLDSKGAFLDGSVLLGSRKINLLQADIALDLDFRDDAFLPYSGTRLYVQHQNGLIFNDNDNNYGKSLAFFEHFTGFHFLTGFSLGLKTGIAGSYGSIPFYNQFVLGQNTYLRGYLNNRFIGKSITFFNSDLRFHIATIKTSVVPLRFGAKVFFDTGRVLGKGNSNTWHRGYGFGIYLVPLYESFTLNTSVGFSDEETVLIKFGLGTAFH